MVRCMMRGLGRRVVGRRGIGRRAVLCGGFALASGALAGCALGVDPVAAEVERDADAELLRRPGLYVNGAARGWTVTRDGAERGTLWGTVHVRYEGDTVMPRAVRERFGASSSVTVEDLPGAARAAALQRSFGQALATPDEGALAGLDVGTRVRLRDAGVTPRDEGRLSLLGLAQVATRRGASVEAGSFLPGGQIVDLNLVGFARSVDIPVRTLEALDRSPDPVWAEPNGTAAADNLRLALRRLDGLQAFGAVLLRMYGAGDVSRLMAAAAAWRAGPADLANSDASRAAVLAARNRAWVGPLEQTLRLPGTHFVAFGAGHLPGEEGVVALLRRRGWGVEGFA